MAENVALTGSLEPDPGATSYRSIHTYIQYTLIDILILFVNDNAVRNIIVHTYIHMIKIMLTYQARGREGLPCHQREQLESLTGAQQPHRKQRKCKQQQQQRGRNTNIQLSIFGKPLLFTNNFET